MKHLTNGTKLMKLDKATMDVWMWTTMKFNKKKRKKKYEKGTIKMKYMTRSIQQTARN